MEYKFAGNVFFTVHVIVLSMQNPGNIQFVKKSGTRIHGKQFFILWHNYIDERSFV